MFKSGFVSLVGRPNVGKSTLINQIIGKKVSIVSYRPQTTRDVIRGVYNDDDCQIIFTDTPGIHKSEDLLGDIMNSNATSVTRDVEVILFLVDAAKKNFDSDKYIIDKIKDSKLPIILVVNKIDAIPKKELLDLLIHYDSLKIFNEIIPISALKNDNIDHLIELIKSYLSEGPQYYPITMVSDHPKSFTFAETIREKILFLTQEEVPYSIGVYCESIKETEKRITIHAIVLTNRESQKGIIIGENGNMLRKITQFAEKDLKEQFNKNVRITIYVKAYKNWRNNERLLKMLGYSAQ